MRAIAPVEAVLTAGMTDDTALQTVAAMLLAAVVVIGVLWSVARAMLRGLRTFVRSLWPH